MATQTYANHARVDFVFHRVLLLLIALTLGGSVVNLSHSWSDHQRLYSAALIVALCIALVMLFLFCRIFALKAQDRAIRAEESLRHFALTGKLLDPNLTVKQIVALRFAPDAEFVPLAQRAAAENMKPDAIKRAIKLWKPDTYRV